MTDQEAEEFDYEKPSEEVSIIKFGDWQVESDSLVGKIGYDYIIECSRLWETREYKGVLVWDWLIHLVNKTWITKDSMKDLNTAFFFCQDYFKEHKPRELEYVSTAQTLYIQKQLMDIREQTSKIENIDNHGVVQIDSESMLRYLDLKENIKLL
ncbi:MAG TPA: hypothetical protein VK175_01110 [Leadbetterella sp.]|nr:hypothetical protein [Leadbetterella sp.]